MKREIKFKAKRLDNNTWVEGYFYAECGNTYIIEDRQSESMLNRNEAHQVDPSTVCQFTGLKDKNGVEIWEGDYLADGDVIFDVEYKNCGFSATIKDLYNFVINLSKLSKYCTVVCSKFDRKEGEK